MPHDFRHKYTSKNSIIQSKQKRQTNEPKKHTGLQRRENYKLLVVLICNTTAQH